MLLVLLIAGKPAPASKAGGGNAAAVQTVALPAAVEEDRKHLVEAVIVRIMKSRLFPLPRGRPCCCFSIFVANVFLFQPSAGCESSVLNTSWPS